MVTQIPGYKDDRDDGKQHHNVKSMLVLANVYVHTVKNMTVMRNRLNNIV